MNKNLILIIAILLSIVACNQPQEIIEVRNNVYVRNIKDTSIFQGDAFIYALPRTEINILVEVTKTTIKRGPFYQYADQYLGIKNLALMDKIMFEISNIKLLSESIPDPNHFYRIETEGNSTAAFVSLNEKGLIMAVNRLIDDEARNNKTDVYLSNADQINLSYSDLTLESNLGNQVDTIYKTVKTDTSFIRVPILKNQIGTKSLSSQAEEAANFILKLRKRRFYLMTGKYGNVPEGEALKTVLIELDKLEKQYLSLFIGLSTYEKEKYAFNYIPLSGVTVDRDVIFRFSETRGMLRKTDAEGDIVSLNIKSIGNLVNVKSYTNSLMNDNTISSSGIVYRLPDVADVEIMLDNKLVARQKMVISQFL